MIEKCNFRYEMYEAYSCTGEDARMRKKCMLSNGSPCPGEDRCILYQIYKNTVVKAQ